VKEAVVYAAAHTNTRNDKSICNAENVACSNVSPFLWRIDCQLSRPHKETPQSSDSRHRPTISMFSTVRVIALHRI